MSVGLGLRPASWASHDTGSDALVGTQPDRDHIRRTLVNSGTLPFKIPVRSLR